MKKLALIAAAFLIVLAASSGAEARVFVSARFGGYGYEPYYPYPAYYYPYAVAPPPVVYAVPPPSPVVYGYGAPQAEYAAEPPPVAPAAAPPAAASPNSPTFIDSKGRTCRQYQSNTAGGPPYATACLQPDGSWRTIQQ